MLGSRKRAVRQAEATLAAALSRVQAAEAELSESPWDPVGRAELRSAHNAVADLLAANGNGHPAQ